MRLFKLFRLFTTKNKELMNIFPLPRTAPLWSRCHTPLLAMWPVGLTPKHHGRPSSSSCGPQIVSPKILRLHPDPAKRDCEALSTRSAVRWSRRHRVVAPQTHTALSQHHNTSRVRMSLRSRQLQKTSSQTTQTSS